MTAPLLTLQLHDRLCEACGPSTLRAACQWSHTAATRSRLWRFDNRIVVCEGCGFCFLSPCYASTDLSAYYADSFARFTGQALDFSPEKRLAFIRRVVAGEGKRDVRGVLELGGNVSTPFQEALRAEYGNVSAYEPNAECSSDFGDLGQIARHSQDLLVHYFILEHVAEVRQLLAQCHRALRPGGIMIVEVPDVMLYPTLIDALILHEHCNHFTIDNLAHLASLEGFALIESSHDACSRPFGFVAAFRRLPEGVITPTPARAFERTFAALTAGIKRVEAFRTRVGDTIAELRANTHQRVILWGANDNLLKMLPSGEFLANAVLVDSDPRKQHYHGGMRAVLPVDAVESIRQADKFVLFTRLHAPSILGWIHQHTGRRVDDAVILDY